MKIISIYGRGGRTMKEYSGEMRR